MDDRRRGPRRRIRQRVLADLGERVVQGELLDVSEEGAWLATPVSISLGQRVAIAFEHPVTGTPLRVKALVTRRVALSIVGVPPHGHGVEFERPLKDLFEEREPRATVERVPLLLRGAEGYSAQGVLVNVSGTGLLVVSKTPPEDRSELELELRPYEDSACPPARLSARVQWLRGQDASGYSAAGLRVTGFESLADREAFAEWVASRVPAS